MPLIVALAVTVLGAATATTLVAGFLKGIRWSLRRRMHRRAAERQARSGQASPLDAA